METSQLPRNAPQNGPCLHLAFPCYSLFFATSAALLVFILKGRREEKGLGSTVHNLETERSRMESRLDIAPQHQGCFFRCLVYDLYRKQESRIVEACGPARGLPGVMPWENVT